MTTTTHIAAASLIAVITIKSGAYNLKLLVIAAVASFLSYFILDIIPHGFIAEPKNIFKKAAPTLLELVPGPLILIFSIQAFGHPLVFICAAGFSILPDIATTLIWKNKEQASWIPAFSSIHRIHRLVHWFEKDNPDGTVSYLFPKRPLLALESVLIIVLLLVLFVKLQP